MYWLCAEYYRGSGRLSRTWIDEGDASPDTPEECRCVGADAKRTSLGTHTNLHVPYPFNGMGGQVISSHETLAEAKMAQAELYDDDD